MCRLPSHQEDYNELLQIKTSPAKVNYEKIYEQQSSVKHTIMKSFTHYIFFVLSAFAMTAKSQIITTVAGNGTSGYGGDGGPATSATIGFNSTSGFGGSIYVDASNNIFISDSSYRVRKVNGFTGIITTIAGTGVAGYSGEGGPAVSAQISHPGGIY